MDNSTWYELFGLIYQLIVFVVLIVVDLFVLAFPGRTLKYSFSGILFLFVLGFPAFVAALIVALVYRCLFGIVLWIGSAVLDPDKFWSSLKLFEIKRNR